MRKLLTLALAVIAYNAKAQSLSVHPIEVQAGEQTELVVSLTRGTSVTALQFNLKLPEGMTANTNSATLGVATNEHTLCVEPLANGDMLFILYSMDLKVFKDGELLRIPVTAGNSATNATGQLYTIRTATSDAVSHVCEDFSFNVTIEDTDAIEDVNVSSHGIIFGIYSVSGQKLSDPQCGLNIIRMSDGTTRKAFHNWRKRNP